MKQIKIIAALCWAFLLFAACNKEDSLSEIISDSEFVKITATVDQSDWTDELPTTRATINENGWGALVDGDRLSIFAQEQDAQNIQVHSFVLGKDQILWQRVSPNNKPVTFSACYPYIDDLTLNPKRYVFNVAAQGEGTPDLLLATPVTASKGEAVNLKFSHAMHRLNISLIGGEVSDNLDEAEVSLLSLSNSSVIDLSEGRVLHSATTGMNKYLSKKGREVSFIVAPQDVLTLFDFITINLKGKTYSYKPLNDLRLLSGKQTKITLTLKGYPPFIDFPPGVMFGRVAEYNLGKKPKTFATSHKNNESGVYEWKVGVASCPDGYKPMIKEDFLQIFDNVGIASTWDRWNRTAFGFVGQGTARVACKYRVVGYVINGDLDSHIEITGRYLGANHQDVTFETIMRNSWWESNNTYDRKLIFPFVAGPNFFGLHGMYWTRSYISLKEAYYGEIGVPGFVNVENLDMYQAIRTSTHQSVKYAVRCIRK